MRDEEDTPFSGIHDCQKYLFVITSAISPKFLRTTKTQTVMFITCIPEAFDSKFGRDPNYHKRGFIWNLKANYKVLNVIRT